MKLKDIQRLEQDGFISPELAQQIAAHYASATGNGVWLRRLLMLLAGCMVLGGIISLIAANWEEIPPLLKMLAGIALLIGFWVGFFRLRQAHPYAAEVCALLGCGMWAADVALYGQIFQLQNADVDGLFVWWLGVVAVPFLVRARAVMFGVTVLTYVLGFMALDTSSRHSVLGLRDVLPSASLMYWGMLYPLLVWLVAERRRRAGESLWAGYNWLAVPGALAFLLWWFGLSVFDPDSEYLPMGAFFAVAAFLLPPRGVRWLSWLGLMLIGGTALFLLCMLLKDNNVLCNLIRAACSFCFGGLLMYIGASERRVSWVNYGTLLIVLSGFAVFGNIAGSLASSGFTLIIMGLLLAFGAYHLHNRRQELLIRIKNSAPSPRHE
ncbi:MAG: DUF2157 domain-containing protein [Akkermansia muciniphila]